MQKCFHCFFLPLHTERERTFLVSRFHLLGDERVLAKQRYILISVLCRQMKCSACCCQCLGISVSSQSSHEVDERGRKKVSLAMQQPLQQAGIQVSLGEVCLCCQSQVKGHSSSGERERMSRRKKKWWDCRFHGSSEVKATSHLARFEQMLCKVASTASLFSTHISLSLSPLFFFLSLSAFVVLFTKSRLLSQFHPLSQIKLIYNVRRMRGGGGGGDRERGRGKEKLECSNVSFLWLLWQPPVQWELIQRQKYSASSWPSPHTLYVFIILDFLTLPTLNYYLHRLLNHLPAEGRKYFHLLMRTL